MKLALVTDAWHPQVNGVVTTLAELVDGLAQRGHQVAVIEPSAFRRFPCPGYREIELAWRPRAELARRLDALRPDALHIATEGPLGLAARAHCRKRGWATAPARCAIRCSAAIRMSCGEASCRAPSSRGSTAPPTPSSSPAAARPSAW